MLNLCIRVALMQQFYFNQNHVAMEFKHVCVGCSSILWLFYEFLLLYIVRTLSLSLSPSIHLYRTFFNLIYASHFKESIFSFLHKMRTISTVVCLVFGCTHISILGKIRFNVDTFDIVFSSITSQNLCQLSVFVHTFALLLFYFIRWNL